MVTTISVAICSVISRLLEEVQLSSKQRTALDLQGKWHALRKVTSILYGVLIHCKLFHMDLLRGYQGLPYCQLMLGYS